MPPPLGEQELEILRYVAEHAPISVREVASRFGDSHRLARTTILTVMERLRNKGYLTRRKREGVYVYAPVFPQGQLLQGLVRDFVEKTLGGSLSPFVAYLTESKGLTPGEVAELQALMEKPDEAEKP
jgi:predicted transcriptional regulator